MNIRGLSLSNGLTLADIDRRDSLVKRYDTAFGSLAREDKVLSGMDEFSQKAHEMMRSGRTREAFDLTREPAAISGLFGDGNFSQSCLLATRLIEAGVRLVSIQFGGWDTHRDNFNRLKDRLLPVFDRSASALITDLDQRGQLDETLVLMIGDFGRTPKINGGAGRDHYPFSYTAVLAGGGIRGGQVYGSSDAHAAHPHSLACGPHDLHATIFTALGIRPDAQILDNLNRPHMLSVGQPLPLF